MAFSCETARERKAWSPDSWCWAPNSTCIAWGFSECLLQLWSESWCGQRAGVVRALVWSERGCVRRAGVGMPGGARGSFSGLSVPCHNGGWSGFRRPFHLNVYMFRKAQVKVLRVMTTHLRLVRVIVTEGEEGVQASAPLTKVLHQVPAWSVTARLQLTC